MVGDITTQTQEYIVPPLSRTSAEAELWHTCGGVTCVADTETQEPWMQTLNEDGDAYTVCGQQDCNDGDPAIHAGAVEICDGIDNNCDGITDNSGVDHDGDGSDACLDCDDNDPSKKPGGDLDGDGVDSCTDCNDDPVSGPLAQSLQASIIGGATVIGVEVCNQKDDNCNGRVDENIDNNSCTFCGLKWSGTPVNFMSGAKTTLPQQDFLLKGINGFELDFYRLYSNQVREEIPQALKTMVRGNVSDSNIHTVLVNGSPASVINGVWQKEVTFTPGSNTITATAEIEGIPLQDTAAVTAVPTSRHGGKANSGDTLLNYELGLDLELSMVSQELIEKGIRVNMIAPGFVLTGHTPYAPPHVQDAIAKATPLGRLATPDDIAGGVLFFASDLSRFITGQTLVIDGGYSLSGKPF